MHVKLNVGTCKYYIVFRSINMFYHEDLSYYTLGASNKENIRMLNFKRILYPNSYPTYMILFS